MNFLITWAAKAVGERFAPALAYLGVVAIIVLALLWLRHDAYQDGVSDNDTKWEAALVEAEEASREAASAADESATEREQAFADTVREEKEQIDEAITNGDDPFDVLFDTFSLRDNADRGGQPA